MNDKIELTEMERAAVDLFVKTALKMGARYACGKCGMISGGIPSCSCNVELAPLSAIELCISYENGGCTWLTKIIKCGSCAYGVTHSLPFGCVLCMAGPTNDCENGRELLAEMHVSESYGSARGRLEGALRI